MPASPALLLAIAEPACFDIHAGSAKIIPTQLAFVDIAGLVAGA